MISSCIKNPKNTKFIGEDNDEVVLYVIRKSFLTNIGWILISVGFIFVPAFIELLFGVLGIESASFKSTSLQFNITALWYLFTFGYIFERFLNWYYNIYMITNKRIIDMDFNHLLSRQISDAPLRNIEDISCKWRGFFESMFNIGDVIIQTAAERPEFDFMQVDNPANVQDILSDLVKEIKGASR